MSERALPSVRVIFQSLNSLGSGIKSQFKPLGNLLFSFFIKYFIIFIIYNFLYFILFFRTLNTKEAAKMLAVYKSRFVKPHNSKTSTNVTLRIMFLEDLKAHFTVQRMCHSGRNLSHPPRLQFTLAPLFLERLSAV